MRLRADFVEDGGHLLGLYGQDEHVGRGDHVGVTGGDSGLGHGAAKLLAGCGSRISGHDLLGQHKTGPNKSNGECASHLPGADESDRLFEVFFRPVQSVTPAQGRLALAGPKKPLQCYVKKA